MKKFFLLFKFLILFPLLTMGAETNSKEQRNFDSLLNELKLIKEDTNKINLYLKILNDCPDKYNLYYAKQALSATNILLKNSLNIQIRKRLLYQKCEVLKRIQYSSTGIKDSAYKRGMIQAQMNIYYLLKDTLNYVNTIRSMVNYYKEIGNFPFALEFLQNEIKRFDKIHSTDWNVDFYRIMAGLYSDQNDFVQALKFKKKALEALNHVKDSTAKTTLLISTGMTYSKLHQVKLALACFDEALKIDKSRTYNFVIYNTIGLMYDENSDLPNSIYNYEKALKIAEEFGTKSYSPVLLNIGNAYYRNGEIIKALEYHNRILKSNNQIDFKPMVYNPLAIDYLKLRDCKNAKKYSEINLHYVAENGNLYDLKEAENTAAKVDSMCEFFKSAYLHFQKYVFLKDKLRSEEMHNESIRQKFQVEYDRQKTKDNLRQIRKEIATNLESKREKLIILFIFIAFIVVSIFSIIIFRSLSLRNKQNIIISNQKEIVELKNREILDSIEYAKRIQATILPSVRVVKKYLEDSFILYLPKDIVAGDFYWMESIDDNTVYFAACDCTGHGVPGAMVSVVCHNALNKSLKEFGLRKPSEILDKVADLVIQDFNKNADDDDEIKDGMDASICALNVESGQLQWAGANNALWIVKANGLLQEYKADKQPVGKSYDRMLFTNHEIQVEKGDTLYLVTDGYADQFGGENQRKFQRKALKELLIAIHAQNMEQQRESLYNTYANWKGQNDQVDDICIIGVRI